MPAMKNFSAAKEKEDDQLCRNPEAEEEEDLDKIDEEDDDNDAGDEEVGDDVERDEDEVEALEEDEEDSEERSLSATSEEQSETEFVELDLAELRKDVTCPICLGIIRKTRTVMECLHRFCQKCIDKSMRLGNNECPACRKHCASRRSLRDDPRFDAFIAALFDDIDAFEAKESTFLEEEKARNKEIQESIAQVSKRQSEALAKRKSLGKEAAVLPRPQRIGSGTRRRRNSRNVEQDTSEAHDDDNEHNNRGKSSSSDGPCTERRERKRRKRSASRSPVRPSASNANNNNNDAGNDTEEEAHRGSRGISPGLVSNLEALAWGRGGTRSITRQNQRARNNNQGDSVRKARLNRLIEYLGSLEADSLEVAEEIAAH